MPDTDKPLPPPPKPGSEPEKGPHNSYNKKLDRIISPLKDKDISYLFSGAPEFFVRTRPLIKDPLPSIEFPWSEEIAELEILLDHKQIAHSAWICSSTYSRVPRKRSFYPNINEKPNTLSMQGLERGTIGFAAALEFQIADAFQDDEVSRSNSYEIATARTRFFDSDNRVRPLDESGVIMRLSEIEFFYYNRVAKRPSNVELYTTLFTRTLYPPARVTDNDDPYSMSVQIEELLNALSSAAFIDFGAVEMRIRLGQMIWGDQNPISENDISMSGKDEPSHSRNWLLLQILLSCELLIRLDFVVEEADSTIPAEILLFDKRSSSAIKWGLLVARTWLDNIQIKIPVHDPKASEGRGGWLSPLTWTNEDDWDSSSAKGVTFESRHSDIQLSGLMHFAEKVGWGNIEGLASRCLNNSEEVHACPVKNTGSKASTLMSYDTRGSYFSSLSRRPSLHRSLSQKQRIYAAIQSSGSGWLSCSYLSGFVLPGESINHLLMSTLLENDLNVMNVLGEETTLYGGFSYLQRSYWSTFCIVGRVLAAGDDATECMGWVSSGIRPEGLSDRWVDVEVQGVQGMLEINAKARIWEAEAIERDSRVIGDGDTASMFSSDFVIPQDQPNSTFNIGRPSLILSLRADSALTTPTISTAGLSEYPEPSTIQSYTARMCFVIQNDNSRPSTLPGSDEAPENQDSYTVTIFLIHDVQFVTASPCIAPSNIGSIFSPQSLQLPLTPLVELSCEQIGHPLHKSYKYSHSLLSSIIQNQATEEINVSEPDTTFIIDCTSNTMPGTLDMEALMNDVSISDEPQTSPPWKSNANLEMLARSYCSENGHSAIISRKGRSCLSCSIREARALKFRVVIRV